jgi:hypothetical protein
MRIHHVLFSYEPEDALYPGESNLSQYPPDPRSLKIAFTPSMARSRPNTELFLA